MKYFIEDFTEVCSVFDVFELEMDCIDDIIDMENYVMQLSAAELKRNIHNYILYLEKEAKKSAYFKQRVIFFQKNMSLLLYFMQFIPNDRKSSLCMRTLVTVATYAVKMNL